MSIEKEKSNNKRALLLLSGGLDSTLVAYLLNDMGIELTLMHFSSFFCTCNSGCEGRNFASMTSENLKIELINIFLGQEYLDLVASPKYGRGKNMNPCIDCRILKFRKAAEYIRRGEADFLVTGEVAEQRGMSQTLSKLKLIEKASGAEGLILRPLSAHLLKESIPEKEGWIDRERLLSINGRSRKEQLKMASEYSLNIGVDYSCPAGGCKLTTKEYSSKLRDLLDTHGRLDMKEVKLLSLGRHFRLGDNLKIIVGRDEKENLLIQRLSPEAGDILLPENFKGPTALLRGEYSTDDILKASDIVRDYAKEPLNPKLGLYSGKTLIKFYYPLNNICRDKEAMRII